MKTVWKYDWSSQDENATLQNIDENEMKKEIAHMVSKGCGTKLLKSKIKKLNAVIL